jgi:hypothetical protein
MKQYVVICVAGICLVAAGCASKTTQSTTSTTGSQTSSAPSGNAAANAKVALVRFVDAIPDGHANLAFGDNQMFSGVSYKTVTPYKEVAGERHDFKLTTDRNPKNGRPVTNSEGLTNGMRYTVVAALDKNGAAKLDVIDDNMSAPANGKAKMRVINASADEVDVYAPVAKNGNRNEGEANRAKHPKANNRYADEDKWFSGVNQVSSTDYKDVQPYDGKLDLLQSNHHAAASAHVGVDLRAGELYTLVIAGGTRRHPLEGIKIDDHLNATTASAATPANP